MEPWEGLVSTTNVIPGPAGNVQAVLLNRTSEQPKNTQEFVKCIAEASDHRDFSSNPWEWAQKFINFHGRFFEINYILYFKLHYRV